MKRRTEPGLLSSRFASTATTDLSVGVEADGGDVEKRRGTFRSLQYRNFRLIWIGTLFSSSGQWIQQITVGWLVYQMTGSGVLLGAVNGCRALPLLILGPFGGVAADRFDRKKLMLLTQLFLLVTAAVLGTIIVTGQLQIWHLFVFTLLTGVAWAFNMPVRQSVVPNLVPERDLMNALALNSAGFNVTRIVGPSLAGVLIAELGPAENFYLQALAYFCVSLTVSRLMVPEVKRASESGTVRQNLAQGAHYVWKHATLRTQMALALVPVVIALPYSTLMPIFARDILHRGPGGFGLLMAAPGLGAVIGTLTIASLSNIERKGRVLLGALFVLGLSLVAFSLSRIFAMSLVLLVLIGAAQMTYMTTNQTLLQLTIPNELRGRVMGIYMLNQGLLPLGSLLAGSMADLLSAPTAVLVMGTAVSLLAVGFAARAPSIRGA
jgi:MFS family permease